MMKKSTAWTLVAIVIILLGVAWYAFSNTVTPTTTDMTDMTPAQMAAMPSSTMP